MPDHLPPPHQQANALLDACAVMLAPLARALMVHGVTYPQLAAVLKGVFVAEARAELQRLGRRDTDSAVSLLSGIHRKDVRTRGASPAAAPSSLSTVAEVFTRWQADPHYHDAAGVPLPLPRTGAAPSFESLAQSVSKDIHPRTLLDELVRLGLARLDGDTLTLAAQGFVPREGFDEMSAMLAANVADHLAAGVRNLQGVQPAMLEQSIFADQLSPASVEALRQLARGLWQRDFTEMVAHATDCYEHDQAQGENQRMRFGMYFYTEPVNQAPMPGGGDDEKEPS